MQEKIKQLLENVRRAKQKSPNGDDVTIVLATKTQSTERIAQASKLGLNIAGENRVQELREKYGKVDVRWHMIGRLQTNKVKYIVDKVDLIHSVDSLELAREIDKRCAAISKVMPVLVEVNFGEEAQKGGVQPESAAQFIKQLSFAHIKVCGIMTVMPIGAEEALYVQAYNLYSSLQRELDPTTFNVLSMGMSDDYEMAVACGANMIRIGRAIFGERK